jgi:hypothetical protein
VNGGIRGQDLCLVVTNNTTAFLEWSIHAGNPLASIQGFGRIDSPRTLLPCGIVRAHLASCWNGAVGASLVQQGRSGGLPSLTE